MTRHSTSPSLRRRGALALLLAPSLAALLAVAADAPAAAQPIRLHPDNPRYFLLRERATCLVGSGEHYGAVVNLDFDYVRHLDTLARDGLDFVLGIVAAPGP
jgi:hypothetical protein